MENLHKKNSENRIINISVFGRYLIKKWWILAVVSIVMVGILLGKLYADMQKTNHVVEEVETNVLSESEQKKVNEAYKEYKKIIDLQEYIDQSILMEINPYKEYRKVISYEIEGAKSGDILSIYLQYLYSGIAIDIVMEELNNVEPQYLNELIKGIRIEKEDLSIEGQESSVFGIQIIGKDKTIVDLITQNTEDALLIYTAKISGQLQSYELKQIGVTEGFVVDTDIEKLQKSRSTNLKELEDNYTANVAGFSAIQSESLESLLNKGDVGKVEETLTGQSLTAEESTPIGIATYIKYIIFGILLGTTLASGAILIWYVYGGNINSAQEFQEVYNIKVLEEMKAGIKDSQKKMERINILLARCKLLCSGNNISKIVIVGETTTSLGIEIVQYLKEELKMSHVELEHIKGFLDDANILSYISEFTNVLLIEEVGKVKRNDFERELEFYSEQNMSVIGVIPIWL